MAHTKALRLANLVVGAPSLSSTVPLIVLKPPRDWSNLGWFASPRNNVLLEHWQAQNPLTGETKCRVAGLTLNTLGIEQMEPFRRWHFQIIFLCVKMAVFYCNRCHAIIRANNALPKLSCTISAKLYFVSALIKSSNNMGIYVDCALSVWGKIMIPMYRLWLKHHS